MTSIEEKIKALSIHIAQSYFEKRDYVDIISYLADDITWFGTGKKEICRNKHQALQFFDKERDIFKGNFTILEQWYECTQISKELCYVMAVIKVKEMNTTTRINTIRFSVFWKKEDDWKIIHVHSSLPEKHAKRDTYFDYSIMESNDRKIKETLRKATYIDPITQIHNEQGFEIEVERLLDRNPEKEYALIKIGIRDFRFVNRRYGFLIGDEVLKNMGKNVIRNLKEDEACGRIDKDTFAILYHIEHLDELEKRLAMTLDHMIDEKIKKKIAMEVLFYVGVYIIQDHREDIKDMLDKALMALQSAHTNVKGNHPAYYDEAMFERQYYRSKILEDAPKAIKNDDFLLYIQPQFDIKSQRIIAGEVLTRWQLEDGTIRMPDDFIPIFEEQGMILSFDFYMLEKVCKQLRKWIDQGVLIYPLSINQSRLHVQEKDYLNNFCSVVDAYHIPHRYIAFELTESAFIEDCEKMLRLANELHEKGFQLAIDDFGTGYASINILAEIEADILKLDRSLLNDCGNNKRIQMIMDAVITLAHHLDMTVIAEGIETKEQLAFLDRLHCDIGQGFLVGKPTEAEQFIEKWIIKESVKRKTTQEIHTP